MNIYMKLIFTYLMNFLTKIMYIFPVKKNRVLFISYTGNQYSCSPKYISEYLLHNAKKKYEIVWVFNNPLQFENLEEKNYILVKNKSILFIYYVLTSRIVVVNTSFGSWIPFRKSQYIINTWHGGGAYKRSGPYSEKIHWIDTHCINNTFSKVSEYISSNYMFSELHLRQSCKYSGNIMGIGLPRNDVFFSNYSFISENVKQYLGVDKSTKLLLYAPTYRNSKQLSISAIDFSSLLESFQKRFSGDWKILFRAHYFIRENVDCSLTKGKIIDVSNYPDMQELLCTADALISDYSSNIWDFSFTYKPCFLYVPDLKEYVDERDFYIDIKQWHFPLAANILELKSQVEDFDQEDFKKNMVMHHDELGNYECGRACSSVASYIYEKCFNII